MLQLFNPDGGVGSRRSCLHIAVVAGTLRLRIVRYVPDHVPKGGTMSTQRRFHARTVRRIAGALVLAALTSPVWSQQQPGPGLPAPRLLLIYPMGGKAGSSVEVVVTGFEVEDAKDLVFDLPGIKTERVGPATGPDIKMPGVVGKASS